jgi:hypothetical protein
MVGGVRLGDAECPCAESVCVQTRACRVCMCMCMCVYSPADELEAVDLIEL